MPSTLAGFDHLPHMPLVPISPFKIAVPDDALSELYALLSLSKLAPVTYEALQDRKYGVPYDWLKNARSVWLNSFDWCVAPPYRIAHS